MISPSSPFIPAQIEPVPNNPQLGLRISSSIGSSLQFAAQIIIRRTPPNLGAAVNLPLASPMSDANNELALDANDLSEASTGEKRKRDLISGEKQKREVRLRSKAWEHFTKLIKEDGIYEKCKCNHCNKLFTCSSRSGTTHLLRHITEGICPVYEHGKKYWSETSSTCLRGSSEPRNSTGSWKFDQVVFEHSGQQTINLHDQDDLLPIGLVDLDREMHVEIEDDYIGHPSKRPTAKFPKQPVLKLWSREESWINELGGCVQKLVDLTNERLLAKGTSIKNCSAAQAVPSFSISTAVKFLNEMDNIPPSSEMYLDAFELLRDDVERECFICLPPEARRRWLQRMLHRRYPLRYNCNF